MRPYDVKLHSDGPDCFSTALDRRSARTLRNAIGARFVVIAVSKTADEIAGTSCWSMRDPVSTVLADQPLVPRTASHRRVPLWRLNGACSFQLSLCVVL